METGRSNITSHDRFMAPRKKPSREKAHESSKVSTTEYTPVKASTTHNDAQTPATSTARERAEYEGIDESPSPGIFSPVNKPACDIEWAWKSPTGRMGSAGSANTTKRRLINKTPVQKTKRCAKANSPLNYFPSKRKLIKVDHQDSDHLSILTSQLQALKQCVLDKQSPDTSPGSSSYQTPPNKNMAKEDNSLTALLDDDNYFTLLQCSQYVEEKLMDNPDKTTFSPIYIKPPVKDNSALNQKSSPKSNPSFTAPIPMHRGGEKIRATTETKQPIVKETEDDKGQSCSEKKLTKPVIGQTKPPLKKSAETCTFSDNFADDSFDDVLANFCDENIELLSQGKSSSQQETPNNVLELSISCEEKRTNLPSSPESKTLSKAQEITSVTLEAKAASVAASSSSSFTFDDDFLQPDLLKMLDAIESSSELQKVPSPPHQCTPEEIEKKRLEAKMKLEKKKRAATVEMNRLPSRSSFGNLRR